MGSNTNKKVLYKPTSGEVGWGAEANENFDKLDDFYIIKGADVVSEATLFTTFGFPTDGNYFVIPSGVGITSILTSGRLNSIIILQFGFATSITDDGDNIILTNGDNITTTAGDVYMFIEYAAGKWKLIGEIKATTGSGTPVRATSPTLTSPTLTTPDLGVAQATDLTITGATASPPDANTLIKENIIKGWINFDGTAATGAADLTGVRDSYNVTSLVDNGVGYYTVNWDRDFADVNYIVVVTANRQGGVPATGMAEIYATGSVVIRAENHSGVVVDPTDMSVMSIGNQ